MKQDRVRDLMTRNVTVIHRDNDVHELEKLLIKHQVHGLPVVDDDGALVGVVSQTDLVHWHFNTGVDGTGFYDGPPRAADVGEAGGLHLTDIRTARVEEVMSGIVHCVGPDRPVAVAVSTMIRHRIHRLVVVDEKMQVQGIISALDALHCVPGVTRLVGPRRKLSVPRARPTADA